MSKNKKKTLEPYLDLFDRGKFESIQGIGSERFHMPCSKRFDFQRSFWS